MLESDCAHLEPGQNHTIASALEKFRAALEFEVAAVIDSLVQCQVQDQPM